jgi:hypothetical protein
VSALARKNQERKSIAYLKHHSKGENLAFVVKIDTRHPFLGLRGGKE